MTPNRQDRKDSESDIPGPSIYSSEKGIMDYVTLKGIYNRTGLQKDALVDFILKELLDNALDFLESHIRPESEYEPVVKVNITKPVCEDSYFEITVANSNLGLAGQSFTQERIKSIFSFDRFYSSKRNIYKISRGTLGDALKEVICIPYALAADTYQIGGDGMRSWNEPVVVTDGNKSFVIKLDVDKIAQTINSKIEVVKPAPDSKLGANYTSVHLHVPTAIDKSHLQNFLEAYAVLNPHITFNLNFDSPSEDDRFTINLPQTQSMQPWSNRPSIHYYSLPEFQQFILGIEDNDAVAYDVLRSFREATNISRNDTNFTIGELKRKHKKISEIYSRLRDTFAARSKLETQFDMDKKVRQDALKKRIEDIYSKFEISGVKYRSVQGTYENGIKFPFIFEIMIINLKDATGLMTFSGINSSRRLFHPFAGDRYDTFVWDTGRGKYTHPAQNIHEIFDRYGYSNRKDKSVRKPGSFIIVNLISPRIDYEGYSKSRINLKPFAKTIAQTTYKICSESAGRGSGEEEKLSGVDALYLVLAQRDKAVKQNAELMIKDRWTQSTVFYRTRKLLLDRGAKLVTRKYLTEIIKQTCIDNFNKTREELGIFAADRAQMYFRGRSYDVGIDELSGLMKKGTDLVVIEKEGVAEVLAPYADDYGIAILNSRGFIVDYAKKLSELSNQYGGNVAILTDLDDSGLLIAKKVPEITRIGIDFQTLDHFELSRVEVEEDYDSSQHYSKLEELAEDDPKLRQLLSYVKTTRIEIDSVIAVVGNERFWEFVINKLGEFPKRNYNRAIDIPEDIIPEEIETFLERLKEKCNSAAANQRDEMEAQLEEVEGFIDGIEDKEEGIKVQIREVLSENDDIKALVADIQALSTKYPFLKHEPKAKGAS